ncbi:alkaline phosphatase family protein [uncultured Alsobacter sp.]|uniref:alkaline phosphatase family protein n=1 Tax=uncultured Alsobacter sp. TaxID=1748258 RepID=UPI0025D69EB2|nr:alkaline phosphatase family protein [uncultured Alsobacter sp.]
MRSLMALALAGVSTLATMAPTQAQQAPAGLSKIETIVVLYMENRSFDHLFGTFPGANGLANAGDAAIQVDETGKPYATLPAPLDLRKKPPVPYEKLPAAIPNGYFRLDEHYKLSDQLGSLVHAFYQQQDQINGGKMNRFALTSDAKGYTMGVYDGSSLKMWEYAKKYTLADNFFHAAFGGSFLNHLWLVCACTPVYPNAPANIVAKVDAQGRMIEDGFVTPDGYGVNTMEPVGGPFAADTKKERLLPVQTMTTIGDRLSEKGIDWRWYSGGWNEADGGTLKPGTPFSYHHQAFAFFDRFQKGKPDRAKHIKDLEDFLVDIDKGTLPPVVFYKPRAGINQHPSNSNVLDSDAHTADLIARLEKSPQWGKMAVIVTYDENGGFWDHVAPPKRDRWGPGTRVPTIVASPFARKGYVDHTQYDTTSVLKLIEERHGLAPLTDADAKANSLTAAFEF